MKTGLIVKCVVRKLARRLGINSQAGTGMKQFLFLTPMKRSISGFRALCTLLTRAGSTAVRSSLQRVRKPRGIQSVDGDLDDGMQADSFQAEARTTDEHDVWHPLNARE
jgi:hypothetical protein